MSLYTVANISYVTPTILRLAIKHLPDQKPITFLPGQYAAISFKHKNRDSAVRCFSIANSPTDQDELEFGIRIAGKFTQALTKLEIGDEINVTGPYGNFIFGADVHDEIVMCAGGIGITPFMSMVRYATKLQLPNKISLVVSARSKQEIPYYEELMNLSVQNRNLKLSYVLDSDDSLQLYENQKLYNGRVSDEVLSDASSGMKKPVYFLCGPPPFMGAVTKMLASKGVSSDKIVTEAFAQGQVFTYGNTRDWPSTMYLAGAFGTLIVGAVIIANELSKSIAPTLLPDTLSGQRDSAGGRQKDLDTAVNELNAIAAGENKSAAVLEAEAEVESAQEKIARISNTQNTQTNSGSASSSPQPSSPTTITPSAPTPKPKPAPVCTTSASGVTVCQ